VDFVTYFRTGISLYERAGGRPIITMLSDLCGHKVGVPQGTIEEAEATAQSSTCIAARKPAVMLVSFADEGTATNALLSGDVEVAMADTPITTGYVKSSNGHLMLAGQPFDVRPYGIAVAKHRGLAKPVLDALRVPGFERQTLGDPEEMGPGVRCNRSPQDQRRDRLAHATPARRTGFRSRRDEYEQLAHVISPALAAPRCTGRVSVDHGPSLTRTRSPGTRKSSLLAPPLAFVTRTSTLEARPSRCWIGLEGEATPSGSRLSGDGKARLQHLDHSRSEPLEVVRKLVEL
jgi:hypothetical protein